jgi:hypothetical protein
MGSIIVSVNVIKTYVIPTTIDASRICQSARARWKKPIFGKDMKRIHRALVAYDMTFEKLIFDLHVTLGAREGSNDTISGISFARRMTNQDNAYLKFA